MIMDFIETKKRILKTYREFTIKNLVDNKMLEINRIINENENFITTSSCAGRIIIIGKKTLREKYDTIFFLKTHDALEKQYNIEKLDFENELWVLFEPPNIHIKCKDLKSAKMLHQIALGAKLSKSKFQSIKKPYVVEILGTGNLQIPIGFDGKLAIDQNYFDKIITVANQILIQEQSRLKSFKELIQLIEIN